MAKTYIQGLKELEVKMDGLEDKDIQRLLTTACILVKEDAVDRCPKSSGVYTGFGEDSLAASITYEVEDNVGAIGTNKYYAPYVHQGTGSYAVDGNGRQGYWVFVKNGDPAYKSSNPSRIYTLEEAKQVVAIMRSKGLDAYYTHGQISQPFLTNALDANEDKILEIFTEAVKEKV